MILRHTFEPRDNTRLAHLCGPLDAHLRRIAERFEVRITRRDETFRIEGRAAAAQAALRTLVGLYARAAQPLPDEEVLLASVDAATAADPPRPAVPGAAPASFANAADAAAGNAVPAASAAGAIPTAASVPAADAAALQLRTRRRDLAGRTPNQIAYLRHILAHDLTFGIGPAGTGKTFLAVACAVDALERSGVQRIVLTRPAVEAGERLGFLPGDLAQKVDPYLRPLYDALYDLMGAERVAKAFEKGTLEIAPLAFMRGRTLNNAFVILDEAQNSTIEQMKMFLTRIGFGSKAVVTGDTSQVDLPKGVASGLVDAARVLRGVKGIATTRFTAADVVRHPLVARIVEAYDRAGAGVPAAAAASDATAGAATVRRPLR